MDEQQVNASLQFDGTVVADLKARWSALLTLHLWGEVKSSKIGAFSRLNKKFLELGEQLRSLWSDRAWIPQPRERLKSALGAALNVRDALQQLDLLVKNLDSGADFPTFERDYLAFRQALLRHLESHEGVWATLLDALYDRPLDEEDDS